MDATLVYLNAITGFTLLQEQLFIQKKKKNPSYTVKVFKGGLKGGLKCLIQLLVVYLEFLGPFVGNIQLFLFLHESGQK